MKVKELIRRLLEEDPEAEVLTSSDNFELHGALVPIQSIMSSKEAKKIKKIFFDAFDHEPYNKEVWELRNGSESVVWL